MKNILIIGAGRSTTSLINYLIANAEIYDWYITVADADLDLVNRKVKNHDRATGIKLDIMDAINRVSAINCRQGRGNTRANNPRNIFYFINRPH